MVITPATEVTVVAFATVVPRTIEPDLLASASDQRVRSPALVVMLGVPVAEMLLVALTIRFAEASVTVVVPAKTMSPP